MKRFKVTIPYKENKNLSGDYYKIDFEVIAENNFQAKEKGLIKFEKFLEFNLASWSRVPEKNLIDVEFIEELIEPEPWSYL
ncbi:MAG: hypothetical protein M0R46_09680 [Candidatus Muirbacterium halophilum]|nr:hypothetical protein [Candidatus Muirbacterium halophilum]MCK9476179.1 hypothetical protein [Candidatus Muirbacterium halophilum]